MAGYVYSGYKWGSQALGTAGGEITYYLAPAGYVGAAYSYDAAIPADYLIAVENAFEEWASYGNITFTLATDIHSADIVLGFDYIDGSSGVLGNTTTTYNANGLVSVEIVFDASEPWVRDSASTGWGELSFEAVALHEIGHALGLDHYDGATAIMNSAYGATLHLTSSDINGIVSIYGAAPGYVGWFYGSFYDARGTGWEYGWYRSGGWAFGWHYDYGDTGWLFGWTWTASTGWQYSAYYASGWEYGWYGVGWWSYGWHYDHAAYAWGAVQTPSPAGSWYVGSFYDARGTGWEYGWYRSGGWAFGWHTDYGDAGWRFGWTWTAWTGWTFGPFYSTGTEYGWYTVGAWAFGWHYDAAPYAWGYVLTT